MIEIIFYLIPIIVLILGAILCIGFHKKDFNNDIVIVFNLGAVIFNSFLILLDNTVNLHVYSYDIDANSLFISEFVLISAIILSISMKFLMKTIQLKYVFNSLFMMMETAFIALTLTTDLIVIMTLFMFELALITLLFYFGSYRKEYLILKKYMMSVMISVVILFVLVGYIYLLTGSVRLYDIINGTYTFDIGSKLIIMLLSLFAFGIPCGVFPLTIKHNKDFYENTNIITMQSMINIQFPVFLFLIFRITSTFDVLEFYPYSNPSAIFAGVILILIGVVSIVISITHNFLEFFKKLRSNSCNIKIIQGSQAIAQFNLLLIVYGLSIFINPVSANIESLYLLLFQLFILFNLGNNLIFATLMSISDEKGYLDITKVTVSAYQAKMSFGLLGTLVIYSFPGLIGYYSILNIINIITAGLINENLASLLGITVMICLFAFVFNTIIINTLIYVTLFLRKRESRLQDQYPSKKDIKRDMMIFSPLIICIGLAIGLHILIYFFNPIIRSYINTLVGIIFA
jgi:hypothetical protein